MVVLLDLILQWIVMEALKGISIRQEDGGISWEFAKEKDTAFIKVHTSSLT